MIDLNKRADRSTIDSVGFVTPLLRGKVRLAAGLGINVIGAAVLLAHGMGFLAGSV